MKMTGMAGIGPKTAHKEKEKRGYFLSPEKSSVQHPDPKGEAGRIYNELTEISARYSSLGKEIKKKDREELLSSAAAVFQRHLAAEGRARDELVSLILSKTGGADASDSLVDSGFIAVRIGLGTGLEKAALVRLGVLSLLAGSDLRTKRPSIYSGDKTVLESEFAGHIILEAASNDLPGEMPLGISADRFARIISVADTFISLIYPSPGKRKLSAHEALKQLIDNVKGELNSLLVRTLIEELSVYPPGSVVKLNTLEFGVVVFANKKFPTRPVVSLIKDKAGKDRSGNLVDLSKEPLLSIKEAVE